VKFDELVSSECNRECNIKLLTEQIKHQCVEEAHADSSGVFT